MSRAQRLQRRYVEDANFIRKRPIESFPDELVDGAEKRGERLPGSGRRGD